MGTTEAEHSELEEGGAEARCGLFWVAAYLTDQAYGGPEEGGWWHRQSELVTDPEIYARLGCYPSAFPCEVEAEEHSVRMARNLAELNAGRPSQYSVLSQGEYEIVVLQAPALPRCWPETRPHYE